MNKECSQLARNPLDASCNLEVWSDAAFKSLEQAKEDERKKCLSKSHRRFKFKPEAYQWAEIVKFMRNSGYNHTSEQCKEKWTLEQNLYIAVADYHCVSGHENYFDLSQEAKMAHNLPLDYTMDVYEWMGTVLKDSAIVNPTGIEDSGKPRVRKNKRSSSAEGSESFSSYAKISDKKSRNSSGSSQIARIEETAAKSQQKKCLLDYEQKRFQMMMEAPRGQDK